LRAEAGAGRRSNLRRPPNRSKRGRPLPRVGRLTSARCYAPLGSEGFAKGVEGEARVPPGDVGAMVEEYRNLFGNLRLGHVIVPCFAFAVLELHMSVADLEDIWYMVREHPLLQCFCRLAPPFGNHV